MSKETKENYIKRRKNEILDDVFNIARLELFDATLIDDELELHCPSDAKNRIDFLNRRIMQAAKAVIVSTDIERI